MEYRDPILVINLKDGGLSVANVQALREHCFVVETSTPDEFHYFATESDQERKEWKHVIKHGKPKTTFPAAAGEPSTNDDWVLNFK